ncbi:MAG: GTPase HflX, partial [Anaerolineales bacterium]|nr:GTPase HflX [Anaerolineales bacterium]
PRAVAVSARKKTGIPELLTVLQSALYETYTPILVRLPYRQGNLISIFHKAGQIECIEHKRGYVLIEGRLPGRLIAQFSDWQINPDEPSLEEDLT